MASYITGPQFDPNAITKTKYGYVFGTGLTGLPDAADRVREAQRTYDPLNPGALTSAVHKYQSIQDRRANARVVPLPDNGSTPAALAAPRVSLPTEGASPTPGWFQERLKQAGPTGNGGKNAWNGGVPDSTPDERIARLITRRIAQGLRNPNSVAATRGAGLALQAQGQGLGAAPWWMNEEEF